MTKGTPEQPSDEPEITNSIPENEGVKLNKDLEGGESPKEGAGFDRLVNDPEHRREWFKEAELRKKEWEKKEEERISRKYPGDYRAFQRFTVLENDYHLEIGDSGKEKWEKDIDLLYVEGVKKIIDSLEIAFAKVNPGRPLPERASRMLESKLITKVGRPQFDVMWRYGDYSKIADRVKRSLVNDLFFRARKGLDKLKQDRDNNISNYLEVTSMGGEKISEEIIQGLNKGTVEKMNIILHYVRGKSLKSEEIIKETSEDISNIDKYIDDYIERNF